MLHEGVPLACVHLMQYADYKHKKKIFHPSSTCLGEIKTEVCISIQLVLNSWSCKELTITADSNWT